MRHLYSICTVALGGLLAALPAGFAAAQTTPAPDTTRLHYTEEATPARLADAPLLVQRQERGQWKLGLNNFIVNGYPFSQNSLAPAYSSRYGLHLAYERRLGRAWSGQAELSPALTHYRPDGSPDPIAAGVQLRAQLAGRYYHNLERRLRLGRRTAGFSANYFALALGVGVGTGAGPSETPFHFLKNGRGPATDAALLYGLQRRLGRYGFADLNVGLSAALRAGQVQGVGPVASLRVGLALPAIASEAPLVAPPDEVSTLLPRFFAGLQTGDARYYARYSYANPYPKSYQVKTATIEKEVYYEYDPHFDGDGMGRNGFDNDWTLYFYGGYYLRPRLALQLGAQYGQIVNNVGGSSIRKAGEDWRFIRHKQLNESVLALPVQARYALTRSFRRRLQVEAVGGAALVRSMAHFREYQTEGYNVTDEVVFEFRRQALGVTANLGGALSYGLDRRRRAQLTVDYGVLQDLRSLFDAPEPLAEYAKIGLRYRFGYR